MRYGKTFTRVHDPLVWRDAADHLLRSAGVRVLFHTLIIDVLLEGDHVTGAIAWSKQGRLRISAKLVIDATGDADVVAMAGFPSFVGDEGRVQNPTMIFRMLGVDTARFRREYGDDTIMPARITELLKESNGKGYVLPRAKIWLFTTTRPGELLCNCTRIIGPDGRELNTLLAADFTDAEIEGRLQIREYARFFRDHLAGCESSFINDSGVQVGVRQTRQAQGLQTLMNDDVVKARVWRRLPARQGDRVTPARGHGSSGSSTIFTKCRTAASFRNAARGCSSLGVACRRSTRRWRPQGSRPSVFHMATRSASPRRRACVTT